MTQEQALEQFKAMFPEKAEHLAVARMRTIGKEYGHQNEFILWDFSCDGGKGCEIVAKSAVCWEEALHKATPAPAFAKDDSPVDEAVAA